MKLYLRYAAKFIRVNLKCISLFLLAFQFFTTTSLAQTTLYQFGQSGGPQGSLISDGTFLYGMTFHGGANNLGAVFKILPDGTGYVSLLDFDGTNGSEPTGSLLSDGTFLYGMTSKGGASDMGTVFKIELNGSGYVKLLDFSGANGNYPRGSLISDGTFLYGMTTWGGTGNVGTIFKIMPDGTGFLKLQDFNGANGARPWGSLFYDGTLLYGMTSEGGANNWGTIFKMMPNGSNYSIMMDLTPLTGGYPIGSLISDGTFLYGVTSSGGASVGSRGTLFKILPNGTSFSILHDFDINTGSDPLGSLFYDGTFLYGTTSYGGAFVGPSSDYSGTLFKIMPDGSGFANLIDFSNPSGRPVGDLFFDGSFLYGMTSSGGRIGNTWLNLGSIFKIMPDGSGYEFILDFPGPSGNQPEGPFVSDGTWLYGITLRGGLKNSGIIFKILPDGTGYTNLFEFDNTTGSPAGSLTFDGTYLYGMTSSGGLYNVGTVFKILPDGTGFEQIWNFFDGISPSGSLYFDGTYLYGMTYYGGTAYKGIIFKILTDGNGYSKLLDFTGSNGANPYGSLISDGTFLYGTTTNGGINNLGTTFKILPDGSFFSKLIDFDGVNGSSPNGSLFSDGTFLYGTTQGGGANNRGTIYRVMFDGSGYSKLIDFSGFDCGYAPSREFVSDGTFLYGVTGRTIYKIKPDGTFFESLLDFGIFNIPVGIFSDGTSLFGMTSNVPAYDWGTIFKYDIPSTGFTPINFIPSSGPIGTIVTITGANLIDATSVSFNGTPATSFTVVSGTSITATVPTGATTGKIVVKVGCTVFTSLTDFIVTAGPVAPTITNFTPNSGPIGTTVTITGTNFSTIPANNIIMFNGTPATVTASTATSITTTVPVGATTGAITVTVGANTATSATIFTVAPFNVSFTAPLSVTVESTPREVVVGDIDGDGHQDLVASNFGSGSISFSKGIGNGCFESPQNFNTGSNSHGLALADLNQDSRLDLVVTKGSSFASFTSLSVLLGNGISFDPQNDYTTAPTPRSPNHVTIGDVNKDGSPDIIVANNNPSGSFSILYNIGNGTFATGVDFPSANGPAFYVATDDVNGDTHPDVAIASYYNNTASIYINDGLGGFAPETTYTSAAGPHYVVLKDLSGDGRPEMIVANAIANSISVFRNNGSGLFSVPTIYPTENYPTTISVADMDNNGKLDLVVGNPGSGSVTVFPGDGAGGFGAYKSFSVGGQPYSVATGDFDEDGSLDIVSVDLSSNKITFLRTLSNTCIPSIASFNPISGPVGTTVTITGTNFSTTPANNLVTFNGTSAIATLSTLTSITTSVPVGASTGPIAVTVNGNTATSTSNFTVTICPTSPSAVPNSGCSGTAIILTATGGTNGQYRWYTLATGGTPISGELTDTYTTPALNSTTTYYVSIDNGTCESMRTPVTATINAIPSAPLSPVNGSSCGPGIMTVSVSGGTNGQYRWYTTSTGGTAIAGEVNSLYTTPSLSTNTTYYAALNINGCESATRTAVDATINITPSAPIATGTTICSNTSATLNASGGTDGQYRWYSVATGGTAIVGEVNSTYLTPNQTANTTYYVALNILSCESPRSPVTVTVNPLPTAPAITSTKAPVNGTVILCTENNESTTLATSPAGFASYAWSNGQTVASFSSNQSGNITVQVTDGNGCQSVPSAALIINNTSCKPSIATTTFSTSVGGTVSKSILSLITLVGTLDPASLKVVQQPASGAVASIDPTGILTVNYSGIQFIGNETVTIEVCDTNIICATQDLTIEVEGDIVVYNALSPNGDGKNEVFILENIEVIPKTQSNKVFIYNRWGDLVWEAENYDNSEQVFTGLTNNGKELPTGTYYYKIEFASDQKSLSGFISLKR